jgi:urease accessory protein
MGGPLRLFTEHLPAHGRGPTLVAPGTTVLTLVLPFEQRQKARQRARVNAGFEIGIHVPRGTVLRGGDRLRAGDGTLVEIIAAREPVSTVWCRDLKRLAQLAYHLGNRHIALEVGAGWVRYLTDHVLDSLVAQLGHAVVHHEEAFEPETGAYGPHGHANGPEPHSHSHGAHDHTVGHSHGPIFGVIHNHSHDHER